MAARELTPEIIALIKGKTILPALFILADFPTTPRYVWTGKGQQVLNGHTYIGIGGLISMDQAVQETVDTGTQGIRFQLSGLEDSVIQEITTDNYQGHEVRIDLGFYDPANWDLWMMPDAFWRGTLDTDEENISSKERTLTIYAEHRMVDILRKREFRYTQKHQEQLYPMSGDTGLMHIERIIDISIPWGRTQK